MTEEASVGRNEPCPCGSGKKYKRCHGVAAEPKLGVPKAASPLPGMGSGGFDPSQFDPQMMMQFTQMLQRLPKGQMQRLQSVMQKAMAGKDVSAEAAELERSLPLELQTLMQNFKMPDMMGGAGGAGPEMTAEDAKKRVQDAAARGEISEDEAAKLLEGAPEKKGFFKKILGKK